MAFLLKNDYYSLISELNLNVVISDTDSFLAKRQKSAIEEISSFLRHRYDVNQIFKDILTFVLANTYAENDLVEWSETAYDTGTTYDTDDRCSYSGKIYKSKEDGVTGAYDDTKWTELADNESLWYARIPTTDNLPSETFSYTQNAYTGKHNEITGWDKATDTILYFKRDNKRVYVYKSTANRLAGYPSEGYFEYETEGIELPITKKIITGSNETLGGFIDIIGYIDDLQEWNVEATNYWTEGDNRNAKIVELMIDIVVYHVHARIQPRNIPEIRKERYDGNDPDQKGGAIGFLKLVQKGTAQLDIPRHDDNQRGQNVTYGSKKKLDWDY